MTASDPGRTVLPRPRLALLAALVALGPLTVDLYAPAFPAMQTDLRTQPAAIQLTLTATTVGLALGQLLIGPWSDVAGRRRPLIVATIIHVAASVGIALAPTIAATLALRVLQGLGSAGGAVVAIAIIRDTYAGRPFVRALARLALVTGLAPVVAPLLGSQMLLLMDWRGLFVCVAAYGALVCVLVTGLLGETLPPAQRGTRDASAVALRYRSVLRDRTFVAAALIGGMMVSGIFAYMTGSSFLLQQVHGLNASQYSLAFGANALAFVIGTQAMARLVGRWRPRRLVAWTLPLLAVAGYALAIVDQLGLGIPAILVCTVIFHLCAGAVGPCVSIMAMGNHGAHAGTAAAVLGAVNFGLAGVLSPVVGLIGVDSAVPMGLVMGLVGTVAVLLIRVLDIDAGNVRHVGSTGPPQRAVTR